MKVLVIGSGGREHAIAWKLKQSPLVDILYCAPGNAGTVDSAENVHIKADDIDGLLKFVTENKIDFTVVGPEVPLEKGIVDIFSSKGHKIFGPSKAAARLENSKSFSKDFMKRHGIPTAAYYVFTADESSKAKECLAEASYPLVIKADGLAAGKGVIICSTQEEASAAISDILESKVFGSAGSSIVVEDFLEGSEASIFAICDGSSYVVLPSSQDHKKICEYETGKNTGGMGSYSPASKVVTPDVLEKVRNRIIEPVLANMKKEGSEFKGCLYCGLMIDKQGNPFVIEFNTRFGDPETQAVLPVVKSDLLEMFMASESGNIDKYSLEAGEGYTCCIVLASGGYPDSYETGKKITGLDSIGKNCLVFHAGTKNENGAVVSSGGRVLNVVGYSKSSLKEAISIAYENAAKINFKNKYFRKDIAQKGL